MEKGVTTLLSYVNNIKGLAAIRDAVYQLLTKKHKDGEQHFIDEVLNLPNFMLQMGQGGARFPYTEESLTNT